MYDFLLEVIYLMYKNGISASFFGAALYFFLKQRRIKKMIKKYIPKAFQDDSEVKEYINNQHIIMSKQTALLDNQKTIAEGLGITWVAPIFPQGMDTLTKGISKSSRSQRIIKAIVENARKFMKYGRKTMQKFKSRKFIMALITGILIVLNDGLELGIDAEAVMMFAGVVVTWIVGESFVDGKRASTTIDENSKGEEYHH